MRRRIWCTDESLTAVVPARVPETRRISADAAAVLGQRTHLECGDKRSAHRFLRDPAKASDAFQTARRSFAARSVTGPIQADGNS
jgi:hypothetical protein